MNLRRALDTALWTVRAYPGSTALLAGASAITVGVTLPSLRLGLGRLVLAAAPDPALPFDLSVFAGTPATMQAQGVDAIAGILVALGVAALIVGIVTAGSLGAGRAAGRKPEITVRRAVGAARSSLRLSGVIEGVLLVLGAVGVGLVPAVAATRWAANAWPGTLVPALAGGVTAIAAVAVTLLVAALAGVRSHGGRRVAPRGASSHGLVVPVVQFAISLAILLGAGRTSARARELLDGGAANAASAAATVVQLDGDAATARRAERYEALVHSLKSTHANLVSLSAAGSLVGLGPVDFVTTDCGQCREGFIYTPFRPVPATITAMTADTFRAIGLPVLRGRALADTDTWSSAPVAVVSATLAARDFKEGNAVGRRILVGRGDGAVWYRVVGVVPDRMADGIGGALAPHKAVYLSAFQAPPGRVEVLVPGPEPDPRVLAAAGRVTAVTTMASLRTRERETLAWFGTLTRGAGLAVLLIALAGMFAVMERWVTAVGPELAVRRALGARRVAIARFILARALGVAFWGLCGGALVSIFVSGALEDAFPGLPAWSPQGSLLVAAGLLSATVLGGLAPGWKVVRMSPAAKLGELEG